LLVRLTAFYRDHVVISLTMMAGSISRTTVLFATIGVFPTCHLQVNALVVAGRPYKGACPNTEPGEGALAVMVQCCLTWQEIFAQYRSLEALLDNSDRPRSAVIGVWECCKRRERVSMTEVRYDCTASSTIQCNLGAGKLKDSKF
jgi:hypothetical protein